jgi:pyruvate dehydrogenase E2 component (dihydrolipoamide acetyltransferase)
LEGKNMPVEIIMPKLDPIMTEGIIVKWFKNDGEEIKKGEPIAEIEAEKITTEIEAPASGILHVIKPAGSVVQVGEVIALLVQAGEEMCGVKTGEKLIKASPAARRLAKEYGIDLFRVIGTGPEGVIREEDVLSYIHKIEASKASSKPPEAAEAEEIVPLVGWRKTMAERMSLSSRTTAHITTFTEVDAFELVNLRERLKPIFEEKFGVRLTYTAFIVKAVSKALLEYPIVNSSLTDDKIVVKKYCNIGIAVAREKGGLIVPVIRNAENRNLMEIAKELNELVEKARKDELTLTDVSGATFTITNVGMFGVIMDTPIISPGQSAILGVGAIIKRPVVVNDQITIRPIMYLSLTYDHRVIDGLPAILFLQRLKHYLENPLILLDFA